MSPVSDGSDFPIHDQAIGVMAQDRNFCSSMLLGPVRDTDLGVRPWCDQERARGHHDGLIGGI